METVNRKPHYRVYATALMITLLFFVLGVMMGNYVAYKKVSALDVSQRAILVLADFANLKSEALLNESPDYCNLEWSAIWEEKVAIGTILTSLEQKFGKTNKDVMEQKKLYQDVQLKTLRLIERINEKCDREWNIILFFYTNEENDKKGNAKLSESQGYVLNTISKDYPDNVRIFAFDVNIADSGVDELMKSYNITSAPSLVINKKSYNRFMNKYEIQKIID